MSFYLFNDLVNDLADRKHDFADDVLKAGIIDSTLVPDSSVDSPTWATYSANEVSAAGGYISGGITLAKAWTKNSSGQWQLSLTSFTLEQNVAGFTDGAYLVVYNDSAPNDEAIGFAALGSVSEAKGKIDIKFANAAVGSLGVVISGSTN